MIQAYDPEVVDLIKTVPSFARSWNPDTREWFISPTYAKGLAVDLVASGHRVVGPSGRRVAGLEPDVGVGADWARLLLHRVGPTRAKAVFRSLSRVLHPDNAATGDTQLQRELNAAHAEMSRKKQR